MRVSDFVKATANIPNTPMENEDGSEVEILYYHKGMNRLELGHKDKEPEQLMPGWVVLYREE